MKVTFYYRGKPWCYYIRRSWTSAPLPWIAALVSLGVFLGHLFW